MSYPINYPTPQGANVQIFRGGDAAVSQNGTRDWVKPQGASFVWFTLIGAGGGGGGSSGDGGGVAFAYYGGGGASGNVTNFMCPAFLLPDELKIKIGKGGDGGNEGDGFNPGLNGTAGQPTQVFYQQKNGTGYEILIAVGGNGGSGAQFSAGAGGAANPPDTGGPMTAAGFYNATANQAGTNGSPTAGGETPVSNTTFVMGGNGRYYPTQITAGYYGYTASEAYGYSQISPLIMSFGGGTPVLTSTTKQIAAPFGCGGNGGGNANASTNTPGARGGDGLAIIVTW